MVRAREIKGREVNQDKELAYPLAYEGGLHEYQKTATGDHMTSGLTSTGVFRLFCKPPKY
jgi:hypothetical protein